MYLGSVAISIIGAIYSGMSGNNILAGLLLASGVLGGAATLIRGYANATNGKSDKN